MIKALRTLSTKLSLEVNEGLRSFQPLTTLTTCVLCQRPDSPSGLCRGCANDLPYCRQACAQCGLPLTGIEETPHLLCGECLHRPPPFDSVKSLCLYAHPANSLIQRYKFGGQRAYGRALAEELARRLAEETVRPEGLIPCPLHRRRLWGRGFNQAAEIAEWLGTALTIPVHYRLIERTRATRTQTGLSRTERLGNLRGAFRLTGKPPRHVALIDDVFTTGATATALAELLRKGGCQQVEVWTLARTGRSLMSPG